MVGWSVRENGEIHETVLEEDGGALEALVG